MNELIKKELKNNLGKQVLIFLKNNFRFKGKVLDVDDGAVKIFDTHSQKNKVLSIETIAEIEEEKDD